MPINPNYILGIGLGLGFPYIAKAAAAGGGNYIIYENSDYILGENGTDKIINET